MAAIISPCFANVSKAPLSRAKTLTRTEGHRIQNTASRNAALEAKAHGADLLKKWDASLDGRTRDSHRQVDGEIKELDEKFSNGLMFPGDPNGGAAEVVNCRCTSNTRARWALGEEELQTLKERAEYFGLDKTENFKEFEEKYLKAAKTLENDEKSGTIKLSDILFGKSIGAKAKNYEVMDLDTGEMFRFAEGTRLQDVEVFAGKGTKSILNIAGKYAKAYGGKPEDWQHVKGHGVLDTPDGYRNAEVHWMQCEGFGKHDFFVKKWED